MINVYTTRRTHEMQAENLTDLTEKLGITKADPTPDEIIEAVAEQWGVRPLTIRITGLDDHPKVQKLVALEAQINSLLERVNDLRDERDLLIHDVVTSRILSQSEVGEKLGQSRQRIRYSLNRAAAL
ncbi:hypothetical protein [Corynebacterium ulcerans]|uniref:hypothetical protein n=1 Tax=Corynebacterium ulcerans TaxID=65058 RepID=UPI000269D0D1|nr:hypothetical protein [Corynebacterium ulcerans]KPJ24698.1 hypothetical protein AOT31_02485 [Corynebacterium ulcerans]MBH5301426.1 hypothetical protein [Corynebacterium ulcerans]OIS05322.1 hypothetical protein BHG00_09840 [Corynebacterium ulcerans]BAM26725.1 hypothetical protein CULC0102_0524 [Corynebacterium ulcerans 0102]BBJ71385.1 hypothetical protein CULC0211_05190 [Corynebacterium ulcerans]